MCSVIFFYCVIILSISAVEGSHYFFLFLITLVITLASQQQPMPSTLTGGLRESICVYRPVCQWVQTGASAGTEGLAGEEGRERGES